MLLIKKPKGFKDQKHVIFPQKLDEEILTHPLVDYTYILEFGYYPNARYHYFERLNGTEEYILIYCISGNGKIESPLDNVKSLSRGDVFIIPKNTPHRYYSDTETPWSILWIHFHTNLDKIFNMSNNNLIEIKSKEKNALLQNHFIDLLTTGEKMRSPETIICISQLLRLILTEIFLFKDSSSADQQNVYLTKCISYMNKHIDEEASLTTLSNYLEISPSYLSSLFKIYTKKSPIEYFIDMRIEQACKYLKMSDLKIYEVAKKVGYQDPYYFSRVFKKAIGYSPKEYRERYVKNQKDISIDSLSSK